MTRWRLYLSSLRDGRGSAEADQSRPTLRDPVGERDDSLVQETSPSLPCSSPIGDIWTELDQAELDLIVWELVTNYWVHRSRCERCRGNYACQGMAEAVHAMEEWRFGRQLRSRMEALMPSTPA
jgi:hypothetical protein